MIVIVAFIRSTILLLSSGNKMVAWRRSCSSRKMTAEGIDLVCWIHLLSEAIAWMFFNYHPPKGCTTLAIWQMCSLNLALLSLLFCFSLSRLYSSLRSFPIPSAASIFSSDHYHILFFFEEDKHSSLSCHLSSVSSRPLACGSCCSCCWQSGKKNCWDERRSFSLLPLNALHSTRTKLFFFSWLPAYFSECSSVLVTSLALN